MRYGIVLLSLLFLLGGLTAPSVAGEDAGTDADRILELETKLEFAEERRAIHQAERAQWMQMLEQMQTALATTREQGSAATKALQTELEALQQDLMEEQKRHVADVMLLQAELCRANEVAEANRLRAVQAMQALAAAQEAKSRLTEKLTLLEAELARLRSR